ncbi:Dephospho-CoA kinase [Roseibacterium elongatum DSM 19469]|uniref:Dephospho-CoA kinase n=1 Tax=Roseicyclus elongatus DSM 19469 TaxID=1294273 RepID=W8RQP3_9RHOB|nr:dephospho-CoA kinase [Roseibacterium elongatum]AHM03459.1 Dephospho-CoA kinase [Roseibacterium elongatum DSM 19469]
MSFVLGLTGSIGMGKSTTARMFADLGIPVWDADAAVHALYAPGGAAVGPVADLAPSAKVHEGIDRDRLKAALAENPELLDQLEKVVHPLVAGHRKAFLRDHAKAPIVVLDIPLLFETGGESLVDAVAVVTTDAETQRQRVLDRRTMTEDQFETIKARQIADEVKRARADHIIRTDSLEQTRETVKELVSKLTGSAHA